MKKIFVAGIKKTGSNMKTIFVAGNPLVEKDSLALQVAEQLRGKIKGIEFREIESLDEIKERKNICIMDVAAGIKKVELIERVDELQTKQPISSHDFDLAMQLKLLQKIGKLEKVKIIAIPAGYNMGKAMREAQKVIKNLRQ